MTYRPLEQKVSAFILQHQLLKADETVLVAISGGLDSMVLLHILYRLQYTVRAAHCNYKLRGEASDADEFLCEATCKELQIPFLSRHFNTREIARQQQASIQMSARTLRYDWFKQLAVTHGYTAIATAHHRNDQAETLLLNIIKGKSIESLHGIPIRNNNIVRPLLNCTKEELRKYALDKNIQWREDSSNEDHTYQRNLIRWTILPLVRKINPAADEHLSRMAERMHEWNLLAEEGLKNILASCVEEKEKLILIHLQRIVDHPAKKMLLWKLLAPYGFEGAVLEDISCIPFQSGKKFFSTDYTLTYDRDCFLLEKNDNRSFTPVFIETSAIQKTSFEYGILTLDKIENQLSQEALKDAHQAFLDADLVVFPLEIRPWLEGDRFYPLGMNHTKKLSDYFIDKKIPVPEKHRKRLVVSNGKIIWIIGDRIDQRFRVTEKTKHVLHLTWIPDAY